MAHKFDPQNMKRLDTDKRRALMPPGETLISLGLKPTDIMADIGCGAGYFSIPAALHLSSDAAEAGEDLVTASGLVYALDISEDMLDEVTEKALDLDLPNIICIKTEEYNLKIQDEIIDFALICNVLHEIEDKPSFLSEIHRILVPGGILAIIEWQKISEEYGPKAEERISQPELLQFLEQSGFAPINSFDFEESFYAMSVRRV